MNTILRCTKLRTSAISSNVICYLYYITYTHYPAELVILTRFLDSCPSARYDTNKSEELVQVLSTTSSVGNHLCDAKIFQQAQ